MKPKPFKRYLTKNVELAFLWSSAIESNRSWFCNKIKLIKIKEDFIALTTHIDHVKPLGRAFSYWQRHECMHGYLKGSGIHCHCSNWEIKDEREASSIYRKACMVATIGLLKWEILIHPSGSYMSQSTIKM